MGFSPHSMTEGGEGRRRRGGKKQREEYGKEEKENLRKRGRRREGEREYESDSKLISHTTQKLAGYDPQTVYPSCPVQSKVWVA